MKIKYELTTDDLIAFNIYEFLQSATYKNIAMTRSVLYTAFIFTAGLILSWILQQLFFLIIFSPLAILWFFTQKKRYLKMINQNILKSLSKRDNSGTTGTQIIEIEMNVEKEVATVICIDEFSTTHYSKGFICSIESNEKYYFLFQAATKATIIPKSAFPDEEYEKEFIKKLTLFNRTEKL